jgi:uncharacterized BrkB/YihY/UPF0761 family membrane protein
MNELTIAIFLAVVANRIIEAFVAPLKNEFPEIDFWWLIYVAWVVGGLLSWFAGVNLFAPFVPTLDPLIGRVLTAVVVGGGSNLLADLFSVNANKD